MRNTSPTSSHDCIVAWSGGVESTCLVYQLLLEKRNPLIIHLQIHSHDIAVNMFETYAVERMADVLNVDVEYIDVRSPIPDRDRTAEFWKPRAYGGGYPVLPMWTSMAFLTQITNPWCTDIYIGKNRSDGNADTWEVAQKYCAEQGKLFGFESRMSAPLENLSKREQWAMIPKDLQKLVRWCTSSKSLPCGTCSKCKEKERFIDQS